MTGFKTHRNSEQILCQSFPDPSLDKTSAQVGTFPVLIENYDRKRDQPTYRPTDGQEESKGNYTSNELTPKLSPDPNEKALCD